MHQTNWLLPSKVKHAFLIVAADRQQKNAFAAHNCVLASQSPLTGFVPNGVFMSRESVGGQIAIVPPWQLRGCGKDGHIWPGRSPVVVRHSPSSSLGGHETVPGRNCDSRYGDH